jgi:hypothetical protein
MRIQRFGIGDQVIVNAYCPRVKAIVRGFTFSKHRGVLIVAVSKNGVKYRLPALKLEISQINQ